MVLTHFLTRPLGNGCGCGDCWNVERTDAEGVTAPTQTPSAPTRSEEGHRVGASRRARLSRDGRTPTRRRPSRRVMRACGASLRKRPHRPGVAQAVADGVNYPRGLLQYSPSLTSVGGLVEMHRMSVVNGFPIGTSGDRYRARETITVKKLLRPANSRGLFAFPLRIGDEGTNKGKGDGHF